jgi:hypothetical protein
MLFTWFGRCRSSKHPQRVGRPTSLRSTDLRLVAHRLLAVLLSVCIYHRHTSSIFSFHDTRIVESEREGKHPLQKFESCTTPQHSSVSKVLVHGAFHSHPPLGLTRHPIVLRFPAPISLKERPMYWWMRSIACHPSPSSEDEHPHCLPSGGTSAGHIAGC